jgi:hypothetical protein
MTLMRRLTRFTRDTEGQLSIEAAMMVPLICWIYFSTFTYFETFRADATNIKAAYAIGDMLSRETAGVDKTYVDGLNSVFAYMTVARKPTWLRVSSVGYDSVAEDFVLNWSSASGTKLGLVDIEAIRASIPAMSAGDTVIVVETYMPYQPEFNIGLKPFTYRNVVVTRPRFAPKLDWLTGV